MTEALPSVTVVVPTYNRKMNLPRVLRPLLDDPATSEVIVVVDGCRDGTLELLQALTANEPRLRPVFIENRGTSGAHQVGVEQATGEVVLLLADDVVAESGLVTGHAQRHLGTSGLVVVGYMPTATAPVRRAGQFASHLYAQEYERCCERYDEEPGEILRSLWGGNVSIRAIDCRRVPVHVAEFSERYHEDQDFGIRCMKAGLTGLFDRELLASHIHSRSLDAFLSDARKEGAGRTLLHRLHGDVLGPLALAEFSAGLPRVLRLVVCASRQEAVRRLVVGIICFAIRASGPLRAFGLETRGARLLRRIEQQHGAMALQVGVRAPV